MSHEGSSGGGIADELPAVTISLLGPSTDRAMTIAPVLCVADHTWGGDSVLFRAGRAQNYGHIAELAEIFASSSIQIDGEGLIGCWLSISLNGSNDAVLSGKDIGADRSNARLSASLRLIPAKTRFTGRSGVSPLTGDRETLWGGRRDFLPGS